MITLNDIVHSPALEPWFDRIAGQPNGLVVVAGLAGDGPGGVLGILCRQMLAAPSADGRPRRACAVGGKAHFLRLGRVPFLKAGDPGAPAYAEALVQAAAQGADLVVLDRLTAENAAAALRLAARGVAVVAPLDTLLVGGHVLGHLANLGVPEALLAHVGWILSVQRLPARCRQCAEPWTPTPEEWRALGLEASETGAGPFFRNRGCEECTVEAKAPSVSAFDVCQPDLHASPLAAAMHRPSQLPLRAYALDLARQGHIPLAKVRDLEVDVLLRAQLILLRRQRELERAEAQLRTKSAALEASQRVLLNSSQALISLQDVTQTLAASTDLDDLARRILHYAGQTLAADLVALYLVEADGWGRIAALSGWSSQALGMRLPPAEMARWLSRSAEASDPVVPCADLPPGMVLPTLERRLIQGGVLLALTAQQQPVGLLFAHSTVKRRFAASEKNVLQMFANQAAVAIQRTRLIADVVKRQRLERELQLARELQESILPAQFPRLPGLHLAARSIPARTVGGDFYDAFELAGQRIGLVIADVADKGLPAAMFMALTRSLVRAEARREASPAQVLANVNRLLLEMSRSAMFVTAFYGVLHLARGKLVYARAGHERPLHYRAADGSCQPLPGGGIALAALPAISLEERMVALRPGDEVLLYTDGVTDTPLAGDEAFGHERLARMLAEHHDRDVAAQCEAIFAALEALRQGAEPYDDAAVLLLRFEGSPS